MSSEQQQSFPWGQADGDDRSPSASRPPTEPRLEDLVAHLRPLHRRIEEALRARLADDPALEDAIARRCEKLSRERGVSVGRRHYVHTAATVYVLKALFLRVAEDYGLLDDGARLLGQRGDFYRELQQLAPRFTWSDYLEYALRDLAYLPVAYDVFKDTPYELVPLPGELARELLDEMADLPDLRGSDTRLLGDLYEQLMDPEERKRRGYYTTPDFIIDFLLDRTLEPAVKERDGDLRDLRYLDPACGTGHFLLCAYRRLDEHLQRANGEMDALERYKYIMETNLYGIDISEFAAAITRFRLFLEGVRIAEAQDVALSDWAQDVAFNVYARNSLIVLPGEQEGQLSLDLLRRSPHRLPDPVAPRYDRQTTHLRVDLEDALKRGFDVVNANPPYVRIQNLEGTWVVPTNGHPRKIDCSDYIKQAYETPYYNYDLSIPFVERGLRLLRPGGRLGYITNSKFAAQRYGQKLAALLLRGDYQLRLYADLNDANVFSASTYPALLVVRRARQEEETDDDSIEVLVTYQPPADDARDNWRTLHGLLREESERFTEAAGHYWTRPRQLRRHPWYLRRGAADFLPQLEADCGGVLADFVSTIGFDFITAANPVFLDYVTDSFIRRQGLERELCHPAPKGENIRHFCLNWHGNREREQTWVLATGVDQVDTIARHAGARQYLLKYKRYLEARRIYGDSLMNLRDWYEFWWWRVEPGAPKIIFPCIAKFASFVLDRKGEYLPRHSAQVIYFPDGMSPERMAALCLLLNTRLANYIVKGRSSKMSGRTPADARYDWSKKFIEEIPIPKGVFAQHTNKLAAIYRRIEEQAATLDATHPYRVLRDEAFSQHAQLQARLDAAKDAYARAWRALERLQGDADAAVEEMYDLTPQQRQVLHDPLYERPWEMPDWDAELRYEIVDLLRDMIEDVFAGQRQARALNATQITSGLAADARFDPLRLVYSGGRSLDPQAFVQEALDGDCRPIPFEMEEVLDGRRPKRVDIVHERFFRFQGLNPDLYGWTGWSPHEQANVFLNLAGRAPDEEPYHRWVARLIELPEEAPDIGDPRLRRDLRDLIGDVAPYPYVVIEED